MVFSEEEYLAHYGVLRKSGRYPWGSGDNQSTRNKTFLDVVNGHMQDGMSAAQVAALYSTKDHKLTSTDIRAAKSIAVNEQRQQKINQAERLNAKGLSKNAIAERMGLPNESSVRALLAPGVKDRANITEQTAEMLKRQVEEKRYVDVGSEVERDLPLGPNSSANIGISSTRFSTALAMLKEEGYTVDTVPVPQLGTGKNTRVKVLAPPGTTQKDIFINRALIQQISERSEDNGRTWDGGFKPPIQIKSDRVDVVYKEKGGSDRDGMIFVRAGAPDLHMGAARYAQVRIAVDGTHYVKGMAVLKDDLPRGVDIQFHTNKSDTGNKKDALKAMEVDPQTGKIDKERPFGAVVRQHKDEKGKVNSALNIVYEEGKWDDFSRNLPSQMLSKQDPALAKTQLDVTYERRKREYDELKALTNPVIKKKLLQTFSDETDSAAVHLKAANLPGQATKVILPIPSMKPHEVYAPSLKNGDRVALVRFPHGGTFEIPQLVVNNKNPEARKLLGTDSVDAIGIHHKVAERLSGADFDGDNVLVIPNRHGDVKSTPPLKDLEGFDPKSAYPKYKGMVPIDAVKGRDQQEMGKITNLIADMTIKGASGPELAQAVRHSMVVIDAKKHELDYKSSAIDNGIPALKERYQGRKNAGASTLITRAGSEERVLERRARRASQGGPIDKATGRLVYEPTNRTYVDKKGVVQRRTESHDRLAVTEDAHKLVSGAKGTPMERVYADHSNRLKALANEARKELVNTKADKASTSAKVVYKEQVDSLKKQLDTALRNAPLERHAQRMANEMYASRLRANPNLDKEDKKKIKYQCLAEARARTGAGKNRVKISAKEWEAIEAGAISPTELRKILNNGDVKELRALATPKKKVLMTSSVTARARAMLARGFTQAEVAEQLGVSLSTLKVGLSG